MDATTTYRFKIIDMIAMYMIVAGALNWGLVGFFGFDLVAFLFGEMGLLSRLFYMIVGICAIYHVATFRAIQKRWECNTDISGVSPSHYS